MNMTGLQIAFGTIAISKNKVEIDGATTSSSNWKITKGYFVQQPTEIAVVLEFQRISYYYVVNLFVPGFILCLLLLASFFINAETAERSTFAATIMLSMFLLHSQTLSYLPKTPQPLVAATYVLCEIGFATFITIYSAIFHFFIQNFKSLKKMKIKTFKLTILIDLIAFIFSFFFLLTLTFVSGKIVQLF